MRDQLSNWWPSFSVSGSHWHSSCSSSNNSSNNSCSSNNSRSRWMNTFAWFLWLRQASCPTGPFTIFGPQDQEIKEILVVEHLKLRKGRSGGQSTQLPGNGWLTNRFPIAHSHALASSSSAMTHPFQVKRLHQKELTSAVNVCNRRKGERIVYNFLSPQFLSAVVPTILS